MNDIEKLDKERIDLEKKNKKLEEDLKAVIFEHKAKSTAPVLENATTERLIDSGITAARAIFLVDKGKRLVKDMTDEEMYALRLHMDISRVSLRCINHGVLSAILEREEKADEEKRAELKALDKKYTPKRVENNGAHKQTAHPFDKLVQTLMKSFGLNEEEARKQATNTIMSARGKK